MDSDKLKKAIQNELITPAPKGFSGNVMDKIFEIQHQKEMVVSPLISKKMWYFITILMATTLVIALFVPGVENTTDQPSPWLDKANALFSSFSIEKGMDWIKGQGILFITAFLVLGIWLSDKLTTLFHPVKE